MIQKILRKMIRGSIKLMTLTDNQAFLKTAKHVTQHQQLSKMNINGQSPHDFANKCELSVPRIDRTILHVDGQSSNLQQANIYFLNHKKNVKNVFLMGNSSSKRKKWRE